MVQDSLKYMNIVIKSCRLKSEAKLAKYGTKWDT